MTPFRPENNILLWMSRELFVFCERLKNQFFHEANYIFKVFGSQYVIRVIIFIEFLRTHKKRAKTEIFLRVKLN
jgi:hypothetical protein